MHSYYYMIISVLVIQLCGPLTALDDDTISDAIKNEIAKEQKERQAAHKDNKDVFIAESIIADRKKKRVILTAYSTGLGKGEPTEFFLVSTNGRAYESLAVTTATPSVIHKAMQFVGLKPGYSVRQTQKHFWPKGERIRVKVKWGEQEARLDELVRDSQGKILKLPYVFYVGSYNLVNKDGSKEFAADVVGDVISTFNSDSTLIDLPFRRPQGPRFVPNENKLLKFRTKLQFVFESANEKGVSNIRNYTLNVSNPEADSADKLNFTLIDGDGKVKLQKGSFKDFLQCLVPDKQADKDIYMKINFAEDLRLIAVTECFQFLNKLLNQEVFALEPYKDQIFPYAFTGSKEMLKPKDRVVQPVEIELDDNGHSGNWIFYKEIYKDDGTMEIQPQKTAFSSIAELEKILASKEDWLTYNIFFKVSDKMTYGKVMKCYEPLKKNFPIPFIFVQSLYR